MKSFATQVFTSVAACALALPAVAQSCLGDIAFDGRIDGGDLGVLLANWGPVTSTALSRACDLDGNSIVNGADLGMLLSAWGACPPPVVPAWAVLIESQPDPTVVTDQTLREAISATGLAWRVRDTATQIEMLLVPPGNFRMGCSPSMQNACNSDEYPTPTVTLTRPYYLGRYEVTQAQWASRMGPNPSEFIWESAQVPASQVSKRPVEKVTWFDAQRFVLPIGMRLPTEAEWEYACRAGTETAFSNGSNEDSTVDSAAWFWPNCSAQTHPVGMKQANHLGFHDMHGNVWEWVNDVYGNYTAGPQLDPTGPATGPYRSMRGGNWSSSVGDMRSSRRAPFITPNSFSSGLGFRVARNP
jgi:formylglycine-generating enzyme required for sulfatase activity